MQPVARIGPPGAHCTHLVAFPLRAGGPDRYNPAGCGATAAPRHRHVKESACV